MDSYDFMMRNGRKGHYITDDDPVMEEERERENRRARSKIEKARRSKEMDKATGRPRKRLKGAQE